MDLFAQQTFMKYLLCVGHGPWYWRHMLIMDAQLLFSIVFCEISLGVAFQSLNFANFAKL